MVKARSSSSTRKGPVLQTSSLHYLERQQKYLKTLTRQINSYHCVPRTQALHEKLESLRNAMRVHTTENEKLIRSMGHLDVGSEAYRKDCEEQYQKMLLLEREVLAYIGKARFHG